MSLERPSGLELTQEIRVLVEADHEFPKHFRIFHACHPAYTFHAPHARELNLLQPLLLLLHGTLVPMRVLVA